MGIPLAGNRIVFYGEPTLFYPDTPFRPAFLFYTESLRHPQHVIFKLIRVAPEEDNQLPHVPSSILPVAWWANAIDVGWKLFFPLQSE